MATDTCNPYEAFRNLAMAIAASRRLGWIALGLYIERMNIAPRNSSYKTSLEYHRALNTPYELHNSIMAWADDYRMVLFPDEFCKRLDAIDDGWDAFYVKEMKKSMILRRQQRARHEIENAWGLKLS